MRKWTLLLPLCFLAMNSCVENTGKFVEETNGPQGGPEQNNNSGTTRVSNQEELVSGVYIKNFNQINMSYSKLTGISRSRASVVDVMGQILNQLPANNDLNSFTPFHQISITRLAFTYCEMFIEEDNDFSSLDYSNVSSLDLAESMIERFLDEEPADEPQKYDVLRSELISILNNEDTDSAGKLVDESGVSRSELKVRLSKMACSMVLSSSFVTLI